MGACSSKKSLKVVHPLDVVPTGDAEPLQPQVATTPLAEPAPVAVAASPKAKAKAKPTSLIKAIKVNDVNVVDEMLQSPDCNLEMLGMWENTPLLAACMYGHSEVALKLLARGANVFAKNEHGATALHYSSVEGCLDVTKSILEAAEEQVEKLVKLVGDETVLPEPKPIELRRLLDVARRSRSSSRTNQIVFLGIVVLQKSTIAILIAMENGPHWQLRQKVDLRIRSLLCSSATGILNLGNLSQTSPVKKRG